MFFKNTQKSSKSSDNNDQNQRLTTFIAKFVGLTDDTLVGIKKVEQTWLIRLPFACAWRYEDLASACRKQNLISPDEHLQFEQNIPIFHSAKAPIPNIKNIIAIASGKGGVGKSASAVNLAYALREQGARVGLLDADIYGPSVPIMLGKPEAAPTSPDNKMMYPIDAHGIVANSIGFLIKNDHASIWRGPMASKALQQLISETQWPMLDYLIVDMPPGTGDIQLTMAQQLPLTGAVVITTPQDLATADAAKGIAMFEKLHIPVLGLLENMTEFVCPHCQQSTHIFAQGGAEQLAQRYAYPVLAHVPIDVRIREFCDAGKDLLSLLKDSEIAQVYLQAASELSKQLVNRVKVSELALAQDTRIEVTQLD